MNDDWKPGDLAECICEGWTAPISGPVKGGKYFVLEVIFDPRCICGRCLLLNVSGFGPREYWNAKGFRKMPPGEDRKVERQADKPRELEPA